MCGIWAVFGSDGDISVQCNAAHKITHRGPDSFRLESMNHFPGCCLGFHRLAIMDDLQGMQPMRIFQHPHIWVLYNGEIYNHDLLTKEFGFERSTLCDGEIIIHLYAMGKGIEYVASQLDGVFSFVILDTANRKVFLGRDTFGVRPMFQVQTETGYLAVCSEAKGLINLTQNNKIKAFEPGHVETYNLDQMGRARFVERTRFHKVGEYPAYKTKVNPTESDVEANIRALFEGAVSKRLMADRRIGCLLSGGLDSSLVTALLVKEAKRRQFTYPIQTFSIGMEGSPDILAARKVAAHLGTEHHEVMMTTEEGLDCLEEVIYQLESYDISSIRPSVGMYLVSKYIKEKTNTTVILSGEGADEIAQGYIYFHNAPSPQHADIESRRLCEDLYLFDVLRADRTTAAWSLEVRVPFLDHRFSSYYMSLDPELKIPKNGAEKHLLRSAFDCEDLLPSEILWRAKEQFSDGMASKSKSWYEVLQDYVDEQVNDKELLDAPKLYTHNPPKTKEAFYYRRIFEKYFSGLGHLIPYYWMPKWTAATDPSARTLKHYKQ